METFSIDVGSSLIRVSRLGKVPEILSKTPAYWTNTKEDKDAGSRSLDQRLLGLHQAAVAADLKANQEVVVIIPSSFKNRQRQAVMEAASRAKLNVVQLLNSSTAATISYGNIQSLLDFD